MNPETIAAYAALCGSKRKALEAHFAGLTRRGKPANRVRNWTKMVVAAVYGNRKDRRVHPEGDFDKAGRFYPTSREGCGGSGTYGWSPTRNWPYSYMKRCRTKEHCTNLVEAWLDDKDVPPDVEARCTSALRVLLDSATMPPKRTKVEQ